MGTIESESRVRAHPASVITGKHAALMTFGCIRVTIRRDMTPLPDLNRLPQYPNERQYLGSAPVTVVPPAVNAGGVAEAVGRRVARGRLRGASRSSLARMTSTASDPRHPPLVARPSPQLPRVLQPLTKVRRVPRKF